MAFRPVLWGARRSSMLDCIVACAAGGTAKNSLRKGLLLLIRRRTLLKTCFLSPDLHPRSAALWRANSALLNPNIPSKNS